MHFNQLLAVMVGTLVGVNAQGYLPPTSAPARGPTAVTDTVYTYVTVPTFDTVHHTLLVATTRDVQVTDTFRQAQDFTVEATQFVAQGGRPNVQTSVVRIVNPSLVVVTVQENVNSNVDATVTSTVLTTSTQSERSTLRITHLDNVLEQTVVPVLTVVEVNQVETTSVTLRITQQITSTVVRPPLEPVFSEVTRTVFATRTQVITRTIPSPPRTVTVTRTVISTRSTGYLPPTATY